MIGPVTSQRPFFGFCHRRKNHQRGRIYTRASSL